jgi:DNA-binding response OmpR family regulator
MPRRTLLLAVWGYGPAIRTRTLDVHMARLRSLLGSYAPAYIATVSGTGYRFQPYRTEAPRLALSA